MPDPSPNDAEQTYFPDEVFPLASKTISTSHYQRLPNTPNVCPTCGSNDRNRFPIGAGCLSDLGHHPWHDGPATPAAPGSSSPDVTALAERLRSELPKWLDLLDAWLVDQGHPELAGDEVQADIRAAADALEAQAARIAELERWKAEALVVLGQSVRWRLRRALEDADE